MSTVTTGKRATVWPIASSTLDLQRIYDRLRKRSYRDGLGSLTATDVHAAYVRGVRDALRAVEDGG